MRLVQIHKVLEFASVSTGSGSPVAATVMFTATACKNHSIEKCSRHSLAHECGGAIAAVKGHSGDDGVLALPPTSYAAYSQRLV